MIIGLTLCIKSAFESVARYLTQHNWAHNSPVSLVFNLWLGLADTTVTVIVTRAVLATAKLFVIIMFFENI